MSINSKKQNIYLINKKRIKKDYKEVARNATRFASTEPCLSCVYYIENQHIRLCGYKNHGACPVYKEFIRIFKEKDY